jgi:1-acyl-sn-glycerol-3-phosphate acyltransferase
MLMLMLETGYIIALVRSINVLLCLMGSYIVWLPSLWCELFLQGMGATGYVTGSQHLRKFAEQDGGIVVFNHPTCFDHAALIKASLEHGYTCRFLVKELYVRSPLLRGLCERLQCIFVANDGKGGVTKTLTNEVIKRTAGAPIIAVAPAGGFVGEDQCILSNFRTGAFVSSNRILPAVIKYSPYHFWSSQPISLFLKERLTGPSLCYHLAFLPEIVRKEEETIECFLDRTKACMEIGLNHITVSTPRHAANWLLALSSSPFLWAAYRVIGAGKFFPGFGMACVWFTSWCYHLAPCSNTRLIDMTSNILLGIAFTIFYLISGNLLVCFWSLLAAFGYVTTRDKAPLFYALGVHVPVTLGFLAIAKTQ